MAFHLLLTLLALSAAPRLCAEEVGPSDGNARFVPGEALTLSVALDTTAFLNGSYPIDSAGFTYLPVLGRIEVGGRTRDDFEAFLGQKLSNYLKDTHVKAEPAIRMTWLGYWVKAGQYYANPNTTVWEAVRQAGGIAGERNIDKIVIKRGEQNIEMHFLDEYSRGRTLAKAGFKSGDIVIIPVPRDNTGGWYWFKEILGVTAQLATVLSGVLSLYLTYTLVNK